MKNLVFDRPEMIPPEVKGGAWELAHDWTVVFRGECYHVPAGFKTDGASIPRPLWWICGTPLEVPRLYAAIVHDFIYGGGDPDATRGDADDIYRELQISLGVSRLHARVEWLALRLCGRSHWKKKLERKNQMKKLVLFGMAIGLAVCMSGCVSEEMTWGGMKAVRNPDGTVLVDAATGKPFYEKDQNHLDRFSHLNDIDLKELHVKADGDSYEAHLGSLGSFTGSNVVNVIDSSLGGATRLAVACGELYAKISGGASVDLTTAIVSKMISYFTSKGGNAEKASASIDEKTKAVRISDGATCVECTADGVCTDCTYNAAQ